MAPRLRFSEFRDAGEWEEKTLTQISRAIFDGTHQTPTYTQDGIPFFSVENIVSGKINKFISKEDYLSSTSKNKPEKGDILITRIGKIGFSAIVEWGYEFSIYVTLAVIKKTACFDSHYLHAFLQSERYQAEILSKSLLNAVPCKINMDELRKTRVLLPSLPEQQKIADCLSSLDALIAAQADKLDAFKSHKKGLMQQLFPRVGETVPRLRFPEFRDAGEWAFQELETVCELNPSNSTLPKSFVYIDLESVEAGQLVKKKRISREDAPSRAQRILRRGDVIFQIVRPYQMNNYFCDFNDDEKYVASTGYAQLRAFESEHYLYQAVHAHDFVASVLAKCTGSNYPAINSSDLAKIGLAIPGLKEQQKIADCLSSIDNLIAAHSDKLDALKAHKKGLMQQLFPSLEEAHA